MSEEKKKLTLLVSCQGYCYQQHEVDSYIQDLKNAERTARNLANMSTELMKEYKAEAAHYKTKSKHLKFALYTLRKKRAEEKISYFSDTIARIQEVPDPRVAKLLLKEYQRKKEIWENILLKLRVYCEKIDPNPKENEDYYD